MSQEPNKYKLKVIKGMLLLTLMGTAVLVCIMVRHAAMEDVRREMYDRHTQTTDRLLKNMDKEHQIAIEEALRNRAATEGSMFRHKLALTIRQLQPKLDPKLVEKITDYVITEAEMGNFDPILITALIYEESAFDPMARSKKGAIGLMQVRYKVWKGSTLFKENGVASRNKLYWEFLS